MNKKIYLLVLVSFPIFKILGGCCGGCCELQRRQADLRNKVFLSKGNLTERIKKIEETYAQKDKQKELANRLTILETQFNDFKALFIK